MWLVSSDEGLMCINLKSKSRVCLVVVDFDTALSHGGCEMPWSPDSADKHV